MKDDVLAKFERDMSAARKVEPDEAVKELYTITMHTARALPDPVDNVHLAKLKANLEHKARLIAARRTL